MKVLRVGSHQFRESLLDLLRELWLPYFIDLLMSLFRGAVFRHGGGARKQPMKQPTEMPTSTMASMGRFPSLMGRFPHLNGAFHQIRPQGPFCLLKIHWKTAH